MKFSVEVDGWPILHMQVPTWSSSGNCIICDGQDLHGETCWDTSKAFSCVVVCEYGTVDI